MPNVLRMTACSSTYAQSPETPQAESHSMAGEIKGDREGEGGGEDRREGREEGGGRGLGVVGMAASTGCIQSGRPHFLQKPQKKEKKNNMTP